MEVWAQKLSRSFTRSSARREYRSKTTKGFTLVEVLIAASIFTVVSLIGMTIFVNVLRAQRRIELENMIYEDSRFMMERIAREIRQNTIDYEEYYNKTLPLENQFSAVAGLNGKNPYGNRYGCYATRFYNPGSEGKGGLGAQCSPYPPGGNPASGCTIDQNTLDTNTLQHPYAGYSSLPDGQPDYANAFCDPNYNGSQTNCSTFSLAQDQLYLLNAQGNQKTLLALKDIGSLTQEKALALLRLNGLDTDNDGITDQWSDWSNPGSPHFGAYCATGFDCNSIGTSLENTLNYDPVNPYAGFVPISPSRTNILNLSFIVAPSEDPRKAAAETDPLTQQQPHVTVLLTVTPSASALQGYSGDIPSLTLQTTVSSRVYSEVESFMGKAVCQSYN